MDVTNDYFFEFEVRDLIINIDVITCSRVIIHFRNCYINWKNSNRIYFADLFLFLLTLLNHLLDLKIQRKVGPCSRFTKHLKCSKVWPLLRGWKEEVSLGLTPAVTNIFFWETTVSNYFVLLFIICDDCVLTLTCSHDQKDSRYQISQPCWWIDSYKKIK